MRVAVEQLADLLQRLALQNRAPERDPARRRVFVCFCGACGWSGDIVLAARVVGYEAAE